jgi:four helix bundle protein
MDQKERGFKGLMAWQKAYSLTLEIYKVTEKFPRTEVYGLGSQLQRAAVSIPANIAEGYERNHRKEYVQFLYISKGSLGEVETHLMIAKDLGYISGSDYSALEEKRSETTRLLSGLIKSLS